MKINAISQKKGEAEFEIEGEGHLFSSLLVSKLLEDKGVEVAQYALEHPLLGNPKFFLRTAGEDPMDAVKKAAKAMRKDAESLAKA